MATWSASPAGPCSRHLSNSLVASLGRRTASTTSLSTRAILPCWGAAQAVGGLTHRHLLAPHGRLASEVTFPGPIGAMKQPPRAVELTPWTGPWPDDDPDANFKADVALYSHVDPMSTIDNMADALGVPAGAIVRYVLAKWASGGSGGLLELGPSMVHRLWAPVERAEAVGTDAARLEAYEQLHQMLAWLRLPLSGADGTGY